MPVLPKTDDSYPPLLLIRTDYQDCEGWQRVRAALDHPWIFDERYEDEQGRIKEDILCVDDRKWARATPAEILAALAAPEDGGAPTEIAWSVVFLADADSMRETQPTLLAVSTDPEEDTEPFRIAAQETPHAMHCNLTIGNMSFFDFDD
ncbi:DUF6924 domain-containing protein [Streptomyces sp. AC154]|uniref:DUF6924 domain-containing protein n=1 Tax=Streptomyces sp. AC154 TaxID=3143184 RepID=UPI003F80668E